ncbi:MAG: MOP flippase family protein [Dehalococcoidia bacterium]
MNERTLTKSAAYGVTWSGIVQVLSQTFSFISTIVLARLLSPEDFGVVATAGIVTELLSRMGDMGFSTAIIQRKKITPSHLSTVFWAALALGVVFCLTTVGISPLAAKFFNNEKIGPILAVYSIGFIIAPLRMVHGSLMMKRLEFFRFSVCEVGNGIGYALAVIALALAGFGVWSLVLGYLISQILYAVLRWSLSHWRPSFTFSINSLKDLWGFGANVTGSTIVQYVIDKLDYLIVGKFLAVVSLGIYSMSYKVVNMISNAISASVSAVSFTTFSIVQDDNERLRRGFLKSTAYISLIAIPSFAGLAILGPEVIRVAFGLKWELAIRPMQVLCIMAILNSIGITAGSVAVSKGRPDIGLKFNIVRLILLIPTLLFGVRFGAMGVAAGVSAVTAIIWLVYQIVVNRLIGLNIKKYLTTLYPAIFGTVIMAMVLFAYRYVATHLFTLPEVGLLASSVVLGACVYFATLKATKTKSLNEVIGLLREIARPYLRPIGLKLGLWRRETIHVADDK